MKTGILLPLYDSPWHDVGRRLAQVAELGFSGVWMRDVPLTENDGVDRAGGGDPVAELAHAMGTGLPFEEYGTAVLCAGYRHPLSMARSVAALQELSGNRMVVGIGAGARTNVNAAYGLSAEERRANLLHTVHVLDDVLRHGGRELPPTVRFETSGDYRPPPLLLASGAPDTLARLAPFVDGLLVPGTPPEQLARHGAQVPAEAASLPRTMQVSLAVSTTDRHRPPSVRRLGPLSVVEVGAALAEQVLEPYTRAGLDRLVLHLPFEDEEHRQLTLLGGCLRRLRALDPVG